MSTAILSVNNTASSTIDHPPNINSTIEFPPLQEQNSRDENWKGCVNLGNSCYLNSALQVLASVPGFYHALHQHLDQKVKEEEEEEENHDDMNLEDALVQILQQLVSSSSNNNSDTSSSSVDLSLLKDSIDNLTCQFIGYEQQDAHEFLTTLLSLLQDRLFPTSQQQQQQQDEFPSLKKTKRNHHHGLSKVKSYSQLNLEAINQLLHSSNHHDDVTVRKCYSTNDLANTHDDDSMFSPTKKLVGGRAATQESTQHPVLYTPNTDQLPHHHTSHNHINNTTSHENFENAADNNNHETIHEHNTSASSSTTIDATEQNTAITETQSSFIDDFFAMDIETKITCDSCHYTRTRIETNRHLSLVIDTSNTTPKFHHDTHHGHHSHANVRLQDALREYFAPQSCQLKCERCFGDSATQTMQFAKLPKILLFHISRFTLTQTLTSFSYTKNTNPIEFHHSLSYNHHQAHHATCCHQPEDDDDGILNEFTSPHVQVPSSPESSNHYNYQLCGIVNHIGSSAEYGHYTADAVRNNKHWFRFNDELVIPLKPDDALQNQKTAYLVMYSIQ